MAETSTDRTDYSEIIKGQTQIINDQAKEIERLKRLSEARSIDSAPKDGTKILIHEPGPEGGWIEAYWACHLIYRDGTLRPDCWEADFHCDWFSELRPDLWLPLPEEKV